MHRLAAWSTYSNLTRAPNFYNEHLRGREGRALIGGNQHTNWRHNTGWDWINTISMANVGSYETYLQLCRNHASRIHHRGLDIYFDDSPQVRMNWSLFQYKHIIRIVKLFYLEWSQTSIIFRPVPLGAAGHNTQSLPGQIFAQTHFQLITERRTSPNSEGNMAI